MKKVKVNCYTHFSSRNYIKFFLKILKKSRKANGYTSKYCNGHFCVLTKADKMAIKTISTVKDTGNSTLLARYLEESYDVKSFSIVFIAK